ncbi:MAG: methyltransferase domain-containing protein [Nitratireductor sp.]
MEDNYFDLVTAFSVFTHIDVFETAFVAEIRRILKPGGLACLTVLDNSTWTSLREPATDSARSLAKRITTHSPEFQQSVRGDLTRKPLLFPIRRLAPIEALFSRRKNNSLNLGAVFQNRRNHTIRACPANHTRFAKIMWALKKNAVMQPAWTINQQSRFSCN